MLANSTIEATDGNAVRERLLSAAEDVLLRTHDVNASMEQFARAARMSRATAYRHFSNRDDLIIEVALRRAADYLGRFRVMIESRTSLEPKLEYGLTYLVLALPKDTAIRALLILSAQSQLDPRATQLALDTIHPVLMVARDRGELRGDLPIEDIVSWLIKELTELVMGEPWTADRLRRHLRDYIFPVLRPRHAPTPAAEEGTEERLRRIEDRLDALVDAVATLADRIGG
ncbi:TetR/AcrR family transcriptional regulator [Amycolatopsis sp.]|uniref:TetR/AcrR family transcriptional regulator n=1 Tax=Amycolatopsis sp. TaxID=37632 RepID=UPI002CE96BE8|nr:TetR/AcrR family transcriptional regulator [Amycolatopsis sp.]HVV12673.1 TetR/AcrR family transcriptional regulator [Amycolatopsis sp.]